MVRARSSYKPWQVPACPRQGPYRFLRLTRAIYRLLAYSLVQQRIKASRCAEVLHNVASFCGLSGLLAGSRVTVTESRCIGPALAISGFQAPLRMSRAAFDKRHNTLLAVLDTFAWQRDCVALAVDLEPFHVAELGAPAALTPRFRGRLGDQPIAGAGHIAACGAKLPM